MPSFYEEQALSSLSAFRREVFAAEERGRATSQLLDQAGTIASTVERMGGDSRAVAEARKLASRVLDLKLVD